MKKKIIFVAICAVVLLIFTSTGYGGGNGRYILLERPHQEDLSPAHIDHSEDALLVVIQPYVGFSLIIYTQHDIPNNISTTTNLKSQEVNLSANISKKEK